MPAGIESDRGGDRIAARASAERAGLAGGVRARAATPVADSCFLTIEPTPARTITRARTPNNAFISFPFDRRRRLRRDIVRDAVDAAHLVDDAGRDFFQQCVGQLGPVGGHEVAGLHRAQRDDIVVGAAVAHHADALDRQEDRERLARQVVPALPADRVDGRAQLLDEDRVGAAQQVGELALDLAEDANAEARARERMAIDHRVRQAECDAELAHLVLEQLAQRLEQLQAERRRQAADVVVALDRDRLLGLGAARLDHVGIDRSLRQPLGLLQLRRLAREDVDELAADDLALGLRIADAGELAEKALAGVDGDHLHVAVLGEHVHDEPALVEAQQPVVDEDAGQAVADRLVDQRRGDARVDAAGKAEDDLVVADLGADPRDRLVDVVAHHPVGPGGADLEDEAVQELPALQRVRHLGMELDAVEAALLVGHAGDRAARRRRHQARSRAAAP